jgi:hypothetical protein
MRFGTHLALAQIPSAVVVLGCLTLSISIAENFDLVRRPVAIASRSYRKTQCGAMGDYEEMVAVPLRHFKLPAAKHHNVKVGKHHGTGWTSLFSTEQTPDKSGKSKRYKEDSSKNKEYEDNIGVSVPAEFLKNLRLEKLLRKTDKFVERIQGTMGTISNNNSICQSPTTDNDTINTRKPGCTVLSPSCQLRDYQAGGVEWFCSLHAAGLNGILADEMGLGSCRLSLLY